MTPHPHPTSPEFLPVKKSRSFAGPSSSSFYGVATITKSTTLLLWSGHNHQVDYFVAMERPQSSSRLLCCYGAATITKSTTLLLWSGHNHRVDYFVAMVRAEYVCVAIIHRALTWTTGSLTCAQMLMHAIAHGGVQTPKESLH